MRNIIKLQQQQKHKARKHILTDLPICRFAPSVLHFNRTSVIFCLLGSHVGSTVMRLCAERVLSKIALPTNEIENQLVTGKLRKNAKTPGPQGFEIEKIELSIAI